MMLMTVLVDYSVIVTFPSFVKARQAFLFLLVVVENIHSFYPTTASKVTIASIPNPS
jgi:hypothetical protein